MGMKWKIFLILIMIVGLSGCGNEIKGKPILDVICVSEENLKTEYETIYENGGIRKTSKFERDDVEVYSDEIWDEIEDQIDYKPISNDKIAQKIMKKIKSAKQHLIWTEAIFKCKTEYYAFVSWNVNLHSPMDVYHYDVKSGKLRYITTFENVQVMGIHVR